MHPQSDTDIKNLGYPLLDAFRNEYVFLRDKSDALNAADDILIAFTMKPSFYGLELLQKLRRAQEEILGDPGEITAEKPGVAFERRLRRAISNSRGDRCYPLGTSFQDGAQLTAPAKTMKIAIPEPMDLDRRIIQTGASCAMHGLRIKAPELANMMDQRAVVLNTPRIGIHENTSYPSFQLNIAPGILAKRAKKDQTIKALGMAGGAHVDPHDSDVGLTCMLNLSKPQDNVDTEIFIIYGLGFAVKLPEFTSLYFSGLYLHGGIQPILRNADENPSIPVYYRLTLICYPPKDILHNHGSLAFAQLPIPAPMSEQRLKEIMGKPKEQLKSYLKNEFKGQARIMNYDSEIRETWFPQFVPPTSEGQTTFLRDGGGIMERKSYVNMITSGFFQFLSYFLGRADADCDIQIDPGMFFKSFTYRSTHGGRVHPNPEILNYLGVHVEGNGGNESSSTLRSYDEVGRALENCKERWTKYREKREASIGHIKKLQKVASKCSRNLKNNQKKGHDLEVNMDENDEYSRSLTTFSETQSCQESENSQLEESEYEEPDTTRNLKRKRSKVDAGACLERSLRPRISHNIANTSSSLCTAVKEASSLPRVHHNRNLCKNSAIAATQQPSMSMSKGNSNAPKDDHLPIFQIDVPDVDCMLVLLQLVTNSPPQAFGDIMTRLFREIHLPQSGHVLMLQLISDLKELENDQELVSAASLAITGGQLLTNLVWWVTLGHEIQLSIQPGHWLASFRRRVEDLSYRKAPVTLSRAEVHESFRSIEDCKMAAEYKYSCTTYRVQNTEGTGSAQSSVDEQMIVILAGFFHRSLNSQYQAIFIHEVVASLGPATVFLRPVQQFVAALRHHLKLPAHPSLEQVRKSSHKIVHRSFLLLNSSDAQVKLNSLNNRIPAVFHAFTDLFVLSKKPLSLFNVAVPPEPALRPNDYWIAKFRLRDFPVTNLDHPRIRSFALLVFLLLPLLGPYSRNDFAPAHRAYIDFVEYNTDSRLPFRDRASSRQRILEEGGPFSRDHLQTRGGFFSALIYRGVTHGTQFLLEERTFYSNLDEWSSQYNAACSRGCPESHFCKIDAYGTPAKARGTHNVPIYWEAADDKNLLPHPGRTFTDFFQTIKNSSKTPAFGDLTSYLLSADYATAGGIQRPSLHELGHIIHRLNCGGRKGLKLLGYKCSCLKETTDAFIEVHDGLQAFLTDEERRDMDFGAIFLEHALCKLSRFKVSTEFRDVCRACEVPCIL